MHHQVDRGLVWGVMTRELASIPSGLVEIRTRDLPRQRQACTNWAIRHITHYWNIDCGKDQLQQQSDRTNSRMTLCLSEIKNDHDLHLTLPYTTVTTHIGSRCACSGGQSRLVWFWYSQKQFRSASQNQSYHSFALSSLWWRNGYTFNPNGHLVLITRLLSLS